MAGREVVGEVVGEAPSEHISLVEVNRRSESISPLAQEVTADIKQKHEQRNTQHSARTYNYLVVFQWILLIFCVASNIYLLSQPAVKCECDTSGAESQVISVTSTLNPSMEPTTSPEIITSLHPTSSPAKSPSNKNPTAYPSSSPSNYLSTEDPTAHPTVHPTLHPTAHPTLRPTLHPTVPPTSSPSKYPTTEQPTIQPTVSPSQSPTYFDGYYAGDYKYSFRNSSHGFWLLCNGQMLDISEYNVLYNEIGYQFGHLYDSENDISYFKLPDARDAVMGVIGFVHRMNESVGNETHVLSESELPAHNHYFGSSGTGSCDNVAHGSYMAQSCTDNGSPDYSYRLQSTSNTPTDFKTGYTGADQSFSLMQPTKFIGNLFIYSGEM